MSSPGPGRLAKLAALVVGALLAPLLAPVAVGAEVSPNAEPTWGVYNLDTNTQSNAIQSLVFAIEQIDNTIYVGGKFLETRSNPNATPTPQPYLAAFNATTGNHITTFNPNIESAVYSLQASPDGTRLFVGGEFRSINGDTQAHGLAALNPTTGAVDTTWRAKVSNTTGARGMVHSLTISNNHLYLAGRFDQIGGMDRPVHSTDKVARVSLADGTADTTLAPDIDGGSIWGVAVAPDTTKIYLAGYHDTVNGDPAGADYAVLDSVDGSLFSEMSDVGGNTSVLSRRYGQDIVAVGDHVFWAGSQHLLRVFRASDGALVREHSTDYGGDFQDLEVVGDRVYGSCHCYTKHYADFDWWTRDAAIPAEVAATPIRYIAAYSAVTGEHLPSFTIDASAAAAGVWAIHGDANDCLWVGGDLTRVTSVAGGNQAAGGFAKFCEGDGSDVLAPSQPGNPTQTRAEDTKIVIRWDASTDNVDVDSYTITRDGVVIGTKAAGAASRFWYTDTGLTPATIHTYAITAVDAAGNLSTEATVDAASKGAVVGGDTEAPTVPGNPTQTRSEDTKIVIRWDASTDNVDVGHYTITRDGVVIGTKTAGAASQYWYTDNTVTPGASFVYEITAIDAAGNTSAAVSIVADTTGTPPGLNPDAPTNLISPNQTRDRIVLNWSSVEGADSYVVQRNDGAGFTDLATSASRWHTDLTLTADTTYVYRIIAVGPIEQGALRSDPSTELSASTLP